MDFKSNKYIKGIDLSSWQQGVDFNEVYKGGYKIVILKATEGVDYVDKEFLNHYTKIKKTNLKVGMYHFFSDKTEPKKQARDFYNAIKDKEFDIYPVLDVERDNRDRNSRQVTDRVLEFLEEFKRLSGYECIIYTYTNFARTKLDIRLKKYKLWIAHYRVEKPEENGIWSNWEGFQYTDKEMVSGVKSPCDANFFKETVFIDKP